MNKPNLYWSVYRNLEKECLTLSESIHISDDQLKVYSMHIANLIIRCAVEIEAISKELYAGLGGKMNPVDSKGNSRDLYFDTDCIGLLDQIWKICKKQVVVSSPSFYLSDPSNTIITPLHKVSKRGTSGCKWKNAYQSVKHDRNNSLKLGNIDNLIHAMGALYLLNIYYKNETIDLGRVYMLNKDFDSRAGSDLFAVVCVSATGILMSTTMDDSCISPLPSIDDLEKATYIVKYDDASFHEMHKNYCLDNELTYKNFLESKQVKEYITNHPDECKDLSISEICLKAGGMDLWLRISPMTNQLQYKDTKKQAVLNKHNSIYPRCTNQ